ncbi:hypothetical protein TNCV_1223111 [Trichonephila clavipes]|nr:hypothetical protein TNCV_1223111 [Trichonephila clavipes]
MLTDEILKHLYISDTLLKTQAIDVSRKSRNALDVGRLLTPLKTLNKFLRWNFIELNRTVTCMVLKAKANDRRTSSPLLR